MNSIHVALAVLLTSVSCFAQGQVVFANKVGTTVDAPVFIDGTSDGPGPGWTAQLYLYGVGGSLTPLIPYSSFRPRGTAGNGLIADRYWEAKLVDVPVQAGADATFVVRAWLTAFGSFDAGRAAGRGYGSSDPFVVNVPGDLPPANLTTLKSFNVSLVFPEPSIISLGLLGAAALVLFRRTCCAPAAEN